jgi:hypothetical protein
MAEIVAWVFENHEQFPAHNTRYHQQQKQVVALIEREAKLAFALPSHIGKARHGPECDKKAVGINGKGARVKKYRMHG